MYDDGSVEISVSGEEPRALLTAMLEHLLGLIAAASSSPTEPDELSVALPVRGRGADLAAVAGALVRDLLAALDDGEVAPRSVRLDGLLQGELGRMEVEGAAAADGDGMVAWGYLHGTPVPDWTPPAIDLLGEPRIDASETGTDAELTLRLRLSLTPS